MKLTDITNITEAHADVERTNIRHDFLKEAIADINASLNEDEGTVIEEAVYNGVLDNWIPELRR